MVVPPWDDALGSARAALNRQPDLPGSTVQVLPAASSVSATVADVIPLDLWEERCRRLREEKQPRRKNLLADYGMLPNEQAALVAPAPATSSPPEEGEASAPAAISPSNAATATTPRAGAVVPLRRKRITEDVLLRARENEAAKIAASMEPPPGEEPFGGPYFPPTTPQEQDPAGKEAVGTTPRAAEQRAAVSARRRGGNKRSGGLPTFCPKDGLTARANSPHWRWEVCEPYWIKAENAIRKPREPAPQVRPKHPTRGPIRDKRVTNLDARRRLGNMLQLPQSLQDHLKKNEDWLAAVPGGSLQVPLGRLDAREFHPARSARMQIPEANLRVI